MATRRPPLADAPPQSDQVTDYDLAHSATYMRLLDARADGADWREVARIVLGLDPEQDPNRSEQIHAAHLARAEWMTCEGYRDLLRRAEYDEQ